MSMSDWNDKKNGGQMALSTLHVKEGSRSLKIDTLTSDYGIKILTQSEADSPKSVNIEFWMFYPLITGTSPGFAPGFFRYQDLDNYYSVQIIAAPVATHTSTIRLYLREAGVLSSVDMLVKAIPHGFDEWFKCKLMFCEIAGTVYVEVYSEVLGAWVYHGELTHHPAKFTGGGAYGVGFEETAMIIGGGYLDTTKIYY